MIINVCGSDFFQKNNVSQRRMRISTHWWHGVEFEQKVSMIIINHPEWKAII
jgi:hypothetical protein